MKWAIFSFIKNVLVARVVASNFYPNELFEMRW